MPTQTAELKSERPHWSGRRPWLDIGKPKGKRMWLSKMKMNGRSSTCWAVMRLSRRTSRSESGDDARWGQLRCACRFRLVHFDRSRSGLKRAPTPRLRMKVFNRDARRCRTCGRSPANHVDVEIHSHHIRPWGSRGLTIKENLITLCHTYHRGQDPHFDKALFDRSEEHTSELQSPCNLVC